MKPTAVISVVLVVTSSFAALGFTQEPQAHRGCCPDVVDAGCVSPALPASAVASDEDLPTVTLASAKGAFDTASVPRGC